jgi:hypothetical protein
MMRGTGTAKAATVSVLGGGSWGTALAHLMAVSGAKVSLWMRSEARVAEINETHTNARYLPGKRIHDAVVATSDLQHAANFAETIVVAIPSASFRSVAFELGGHVSGDQILVSATKGFEAEHLTRMSEILREETCCRKVGAISGPNLADEVMDNQPTATVIASPYEEVVEKVGLLLAGPTMRVYGNPDLVGAEVHGALKNIIAIAAGVCAGMRLGQNAQAMLLTRGLRLRGDTAFSQAAHLDRWDADDVRFVFGYDAYKGLVRRAQGVDDDDYCELIRKAESAFEEKRTRAKQPRVKDDIVRERGYLKQSLVYEEVAEFDYKPGPCRRPYRMVVLRKLISEERGQILLDVKTRYFFYITNDVGLSAEEVVREANQRCNQENLVAQLKAAEALAAPLNSLDANWAYMVITSLAWTLKQWFALMSPVTPRHRRQHEADKARVVNMEFRTFLQRFMLVPAQVLRSGRRLIYRILAWRPDLSFFFRTLDAL